MYCQWLWSNRILYQYGVLAVISTCHSGAKSARRVLAGWLSRWIYRHGNCQSFIRTKPVRARGAKHTRCWQSCARWLSRLSATISYRRRERTRSPAIIICRKKDRDMCASENARELSHRDQLPMRSRSFISSPFTFSITQLLLLAYSFYQNIHPAGYYTQTLTHSVRFSASAFATATFDKPIL